MEVSYVKTAYDLFKTIMGDNPDHEISDILDNTRFLVNRIPVNIFQDEYAIIYQSAKWCVKNNMPLTRDVLQQLMLNSREDLLNSKKITLGSDAATDDSRFIEMVNLTLSEYDAMASEDFESQYLPGESNLFLQTWAQEEMQRLIYDLNIIYTEGLRVGSKTYQGAEGVNNYYKRKYELINSIVNERKDYLADDINNAQISGLEIKDKITIEESDTEYISKFGITSIDEQIVGTKTGEMVVIQGGSGVGKALDNNTLLETPNGQVLAKDIKVGDLLFDRLGKPTLVQGVFPQGITERYKVTLSDGREMILSPDHLVPYITSKGNINNKELKEMFCDYVKTTKAGNKKHIYRIPQNGAVEFKQQTHDIAPYALGVLIGDGSLTGSNCLLVTFNEDDVLRNFMDRAELESYTKNTIQHNFPIRGNHNSKKIRESIIELGLNVKSGGKFIPEVYKYDSKENRLELLKGLMDTDGHVAINGSGESYTYIYDTVSKQLAEDVKWVAQSLGYGAKLSTYNRDRDGKGIEYRVRMYTEDVIVTSNKHLGRLEKLEYRSNFDKWVHIVDIKQIQDGETVCFSVDNDEHLFLMNDFIVTHNTRYAVGSLGYNALKMGKNVLHISLEQKPQRIYPMYQARHLLEQLGTRVGLTSRDLIKNTYDPSLEGVVQESYIDLAENPDMGRLYVVGRKLLANDIESYLNSVYDEFQFDVVILDHFTLLGTSSSGAKYIEMSDAANTLTTACKYFRGKGFLAVVLNQISSDVEGKFLKGDTREAKIAGSSSQDLLRGSDITLTLYEDESMKEDSNMKLLLNKVRDSSFIPDVLMDVDKGRCYFAEKEPEDEFSLD